MPEHSFDGCEWALAEIGRQGIIIGDLQMSLGNTASCMNWWIIFGILATIGIITVLWRDRYAG